MWVINEADGLCWFVGEGGDSIDKSCSYLNIDDNDKMSDRFAGELSVLFVDVSEIFDMCDRWS